MRDSLTERIQDSRVLVVAVDAATGRLRVRGVGDVCEDLACHRDAVVVTDEGATTDLGRLCPGDIVKIDTADGRAARIIVVRRAWEEWASPEV